MDDQTITPRELAEEFGVSARSIRVFLRREYGKLDTFTSRWQLTAEQASMVRSHFAGR